MGTMRPGIAPKLAVEMVVGDLRPEGFRSRLIWVGDTVR